MREALGRHRFGVLTTVVSNQGGGPFQLYLGKKDDFLLTAAKPTTIAIQTCMLICFTETTPYAPAPP